MTDVQKAGAAIVLVFVLTGLTVAALVIRFARFGW